MRTTNSFETFQENRENLFAYSCAQAAAEAPGETFNPIYIYGKSGCGKSHLLDAIENKVYEGTSQIKIRKMVGVKWNELLDNLLHHDEKSMSIQCELLGLQILLIDDFDVAAQTGEMQHKSAELFARMRENGTQIVIASKKSFESMDNIESELVVELQGGIIAEIVSAEKKPT